MEHLKDCLVA